MPKHYVDAAIDLRTLYNESPTYEIGSSGILVTIDRESVYSTGGYLLTYKTVLGVGFFHGTLKPRCSDTQYIGDINGNEIPFCLERPLLPFHCAVNECHSSSSCDANEGKCDCAGHNYDCSIPVDGEPDIAAACPDCNHANTFACPVSPGDPCICNPGYHGDACEKDRVTTVCDNSNFEVTIVPYDGFSGNMFFIDASDAKIPACSLTNDGNGVYTKTYPYGQEDGACPAVNEQQVGDITSYTFKMYIQYQTDLYTGNDIVIEAVCQKLPDGSVKTVTSSVPGINDVLPDGSSVASDIDSGIVAELRLTATGLAVSGAVDVGTSIQLHYTLTRGVTEDFSLKGVTSYSFEPTVSNLDNAPGDGTTSIIIEEWCIRKPVSVFTLSLSKTSDDNEVKIAYGFTAYIYVAAPEDSIWFASVLCLGACDKNGEQDAACVPADHVTGDNIDDTLVPAPSAGGKRKRREVGQTEEVLINQKLEVVERRDTQTEEIQRRAREEVCFSMLTFVLPIATLGSLLLVSCCIVLYFWVKIYKNRVVEKNNMSTSN